MRRLLVGAIVSFTFVGVGIGVFAGAPPGEPRPHAFTFAGWARPAGATTATHLAAIVSRDWQEGLWLTPDGRIRFAATIDGRPYEMVSPAALRSDRLTHVALVAAEPALTMYLNGREVVRTSFVNPRLPLPLRVMERLFFDGRAYRRGLTADEILNLAGGPDALPPPLEVMAVSPGPDARRIHLDVQPEIIFTEPVDATTVSTATIQLLDARNLPVPGTVSYDPLRAAVVFAPLEPLDPTRWYTLHVAGGASEPRIVSALGEPLAGSVSSTFMTTVESARIAAGESHSIALDEQHRVWTWGNNNAGQLGRAGPAVIPGAVSALPEVRSIAAGSHHSLAVAADGRVFGWGSNSAGQLGRGHTEAGDAVPTEVTGITGVVAVSASLTTSAALTGDGTVWTWGAVRGLGGDPIRPAPSPVEGLSDVIAVAVGATHVLALRGDSTVWSWGANVHGELGVGSQTPSTAPAEVSGIHDIVGIAAGVFSSYAIASDGALYTWGLAEDGLTRRLTPVALATPADVRHVAAGQRRAAAALFDGSTWAWGAAATAPNPLTPTRVDALTAVEQVAAGFTHQMAASRDGTVWAWSGNGAGQIGDGTTAARPSPVQVAEPHFAWKAGRPVFSQSPGVYSSPLQITVTSASPGATIRYTQDGTLPTESSPAISSGGVLPVSRSVSVKARAWAAGQPASDAVDATYTLRPATPSMTPRGGTYTAPQFVHLSTSPGASIRYTTDGSDPTAASTLYTVPIPINRSQTVRAVAVRDGWTPSEIASEEYRLNLGVLPTPVFAPAPGAYPMEAVVDISTFEGSTIVYTVDGTLPASSSPVYTGPITIRNTTTIRARAYRADYVESPVAEAVYHITAAAPVITPATGIYNEAQAVSITTSTPLAVIRYTTDGTVPTESSSLFEPALMISQPITIRASAFHPLLEPSAVTTSVLRFKARPPEVTPAPGVYGPGQRFTLLAPSGGTVHFTLDGTTPALSSPVYSTPIELPRGDLTLRAIALRPGWEPSDILTANYTIAEDVTPPTITSTLSPPPDANGWNSGEVVVTFHCSDTHSAVTFCSPPVTVQGEGAGIEVQGYARDQVGNVARLSALLNIDRIRPITTVFDPVEDETFPADTRMVRIRGGIWDHSGVVAMSCDSQAASITDATFTCSVPVQQGVNVIRLSAEDRLGHVDARTLTVHVGDGPPSEAIRFTPARLTLMMGEVRELLLKDDRGRRIAPAQWNAARAGVAMLTNTAGRLTITGQGAGTTEITAVHDGLTARAIVDVLPSGEVPASGTVLWALEDDSTPKRASIIPATSAPPAASTVLDEPVDTAALFYVDEGTEWFGTSLVKPTGVPVRVRATTADGRELWVRSFHGETTVKHVAADQNGGLVIVWNQWFDRARAEFHGDRVQRLDGATGRTTWEYRPQPGAFLSEVAVHPDGRVFLTEQRIFGESHLTALAPDGQPTRWALPNGHFTRTDTGTGLLSDAANRPARTSHPIVTADETVLMVSQRNFAHEVVTSEFVPEGLQVRLDAERSVSVAEALVVRLSGDALTATTLNGDWSNFRPEDYRVLPDGEGGVLLGHRNVAHVVRFDAEDRLAGASTLLPQGPGYTYGAQYVIGEGSAYALVHGATENGQSHWSSAIAFDQLALTDVTVTSLASQLLEPSHLRLQFARAGGGVFIAGPAPDGQAHATPLSGAWAAWKGGPSLLVGDGAAAAETVWPSPEGDARRAHVGQEPGLGIFAKGHPVAGVYRHASVRIVPRNQEYWAQRRPDAFVNRDGAGRLYATFGAGTADGDSSISCSGTLTSALNRDRDVHAPPNPLEPLQYLRSREDQLIELLFTLDAAYGDNLPYECFPDPDDDTYNSNSFAAGLIQAAGIRVPRFPYMSLWLYPGWSKPVPSQAFAR